MPKQRKPTSSRRPPVPSEDHGQVEEWWTSGVMPDLRPIVEAVDGRIRGAIPGLRFAVKWKRPFYGLADLGWIIELAAYDVSVNVVFLGGADFETPPPLGDAGRGRYVKLTSPEEAEGPEMDAWLEQAARVRGWS